MWNRTITFQVMRARRNSRRGAIAAIFAVMLIPLLVFIGVAVDMARITSAQSVLQDAVDGAALAGAAAYQNDNMSGTAVQVAMRYFNTISHSSGGLTINDGTSFNAGPGATSSGVSSYSVTVKASGTQALTFMSIAKITSVQVSATATAANPQVQPVVTLGPIGSAAADWNSAYMYAIPNDTTTGMPKWDSFPPLSQFYEIGSNCNSSSMNWSTGSRCNGQYGAVKPATSGFPIVSSTQKLGFLFVNMNNGLAQSSSSGYGPNQYGAQPGNWEVLQSSGLSAGNGPSYWTDNSVNIIHGLTGSTLSQPATTYTAQVNSSSTPNCALLVVQVDPSNIPSNPPSNLVGKCFASADPQSGSQYANMSCADIAGRTFMYWFNDMGGRPDDYDYKNLYWTIRCNAGTTGPDGGTISNSQLPQGSYANLGVSLVK